jgi:prepilin-type N-terminal cleavage/methylation domain-containing protein
VSRNRSPRARQRRRAFTLLELMIAVAIVGILAAIAIPSLQRLHLRARSAEAGTNLAAIRKAEIIWFSEFGYYVSAAPSPATHGGAHRQPFVDMGGFANIGWSPEGQVFFHYAVATAGGAVTADAAADLDEDGATQTWGYVHPDLLGATVAGRLSCLGVWNPTTASADGRDLIGPCGATDGRSKF